MKKHLSHELRQMQSLPLEAKITLTKRRIEAWYENWTRFEILNEETNAVRYEAVDTREQGAEPKLKKHEQILNAFSGGVYVSFSGGKDSVVLKHIVDSMYDDVPAVFVNTGLEYPEIQQFVREIKAGKYSCFNSDVEILRPEMRFDEVLKTYGYPIISKEVSGTIKGAKNSIAKGVYSHRLCKLGVSPEEYGGLTDGGEYDYQKALENSMFRCDKWRYLLDADFDASDYCCTVIKKSPVKIYEKRSGRQPFIGTMAEESQNRKTAWMKNGCNAFDAKRPTSQPLSFWTKQDILHYIQKYNVPYCPVYGEICEKPITDDIPEGQMTISDCLGEYAPEDILTTTGCDRTGCIFCMFGCHLEKEPNRFQRLKETHPKQYEYCINGGEFNEDGKWQPSKEGLGLGHVLDFIGVDYK